MTSDLRHGCEWGTRVGGQEGAKAPAREWGVLQCAEVRERALRLRPQRNRTSQ